MAALFLATIILFAKFEKHKKSTEILYVELDNLYEVNNVLKAFRETLPEPFSYQIFAPKSNYHGHIGINLVLERHIDFDVASLCLLEHIAFAIEE